jgi:hypothetical protein
MPVVNDLPIRGSEDFVGLLTLNKEQKTSQLGIA